MTAAEVYVTPLRKIILSLVGISMIVQIIAISAFLTIAQIITPSGLDATTVFSAVPLGFITISIPLAPGGFGVSRICL